MTRRHRRRRINALQTSINTSQTVAESAGRDARALRVRRAGWGLTRVDRPAPAPGPPGRRARVSCVRRPSSPRLETSRDVNVPTSDAHFFVRLASLWGTPSQLTALSSLSVSLSGVVAARLEAGRVSCGPVSLTAPPPGPGLSLFSPYDEFKMFVRYIDIYTRAERALRPLCGYVSLTTHWPHDKPSTTNQQ